MVVSGGVHLAILTVLLLAEQKLEEKGEAGGTGGQRFGSESAYDLRPGNNKFTAKIDACVFLPVSHSTAAEKFIPFIDNHRDRHSVTPDYICLEVVWFNRPKLGQRQRLPSSPPAAAGYLPRYVTLCT